MVVIISSSGNDHSFILRTAVYLTKLLACVYVCLSVFYLSINHLFYCVITVWILSRSARSSYADAVYRIEDQAEQLVTDVCTFAQQPGSSMHLHNRKW